VLVRPSDGALIDHWSGYRGPGDWIARLGVALADPVTEADRRARFEKEPSASDALALARLADARKDWGESARWIKEAGRVEPQLRAVHAVDLLFAMARGVPNRDFTVEQVLSQAAIVRDSAATTPEGHLRAAAVLADLAEQQENPAIVAPFLPKAIAASEGIPDPDLQALRRQLAVLEALYVAKDPEKAAALKKEAMAPGWQESADGLNEYAWWCVRFKTNLEEAEALARLGVEKAEGGEHRAQVLDTLAEILFLRGDRKGALATARKAVEMDPGNPWYRKQVGRYAGGTGS
jgi:tetratricopeptide (TPR) repeat protein